MRSNPKNLTTILRGIPGCGKSAIAKAAENALQEAVKESCFDVKIFSADDYFLSTEGVYEFDPKRIAQAHESCFRRFLDFIRMTDDMDDVGRLAIVDNTNISAWEIAPYVLASTSYGFACEIRTVNMDVETAIKRCVHGTPEKEIRRMSSELLTEQARFPGHWIVRS